MRDTLARHPSAAEPKKRRRSQILLLLCWFAFFGANQTIRGAESAPEKVGALLVPMALLAAGMYYAFKDQNKVSRVVSVILALLVLVGFGMGFAKGFGGAAS